MSIMSTVRTISKSKKYMLKILDEWRDKNKFKIDFDIPILIINQSYDILIKEGLKFNINLPYVKDVLVLGLENICFKVENGENIDTFKMLFSLNSKNDDNDELIELKKHEKLLNSERYDPLLQNMYNNQVRGQPHKDPVLIFNIMYLQAKYDLSDVQVLKNIKDRDSFQCFLDFPEKLPSKSTLGTFRDRLIEFSMVNKIWLYHQNQLDMMGYVMGRELGIDAAFLDANQGNFSNPRGEHAKTRRVKDGEKMTKNKEHHFGYKTHVAIDLEFQLIRKFLVTPANVHDSQVTLDFTGDFIMYADKGYVGVDFACYKAFMLRETNNARVNAFRYKRNLRISRKRAPVERVFSVFNEHGQNFTKLTTTKRNQVKILFATLLYNVKQILSLQKGKKEKKEEEPEELDSIDLFNFLENISRMIKIKEHISALKKMRRLKIKHNRKKYNSHFKKPTRNKRTKKDHETSQIPTKIFNKKLAYSF